MTVPMSSIAETIADKMMLPRSEYACCIELDKETSQLESAIKLLSSAKSLIGLSKRIKVKSSMKSELSKDRAYINYYRSGWEVHLSTSKPSTFYFPKIGHNF